MSLHNIGDGYCVLHIMPNGDLESGGLAYASIRGAHEQAPLGLDVYICELRSKSQAIFPAWWSEKVKYVNFGSLCGNPNKFFSFYKFISYVRPIVHFHGVWYPGYWPYFLVLVLLRWPFIISPHGNLERGALRQKFLKKYIARKVLYNKIIKCSAALCAASEKEYLNLQDQFPNQNKYILPIGVDMPENQFIEKNISKFSEKKIILLISRLNPSKGILNLIHAWAQIRDNDWHIVVAGPDEDGYKKTLDQEIDALGLRSNFSFAGYVGEAERDALYRSANLFVLPSLSENFGIVVAEAMSYGVPVLTTTDTPWDYVGFERGCICVDSSPQSLCSGLRRLMALTDDQRTKIGESAKLFIQNNFCWKSVASQSVYFIKKIASKYLGSDRN